MKQIYNFLKRLNLQKLLFQYVTNLTIRSTYDLSWDTLMIIFPKVVDITFINCDPIIKTRKYYNRIKYFSNKHMWQSGPGQQNGRKDRSGQRNNQDSATAIRTSSRVAKARKGRERCTCNHPAPATRPCWVHRS